MRNISFMRPLRATLVLSLLLVFGFARPGSAQTPLPLGLNKNYMVTGDYVVGGWTKTGSSTLATAKFFSGLNFTRSFHQLGFFGAHGSGIKTPGITT